ncbi:MAG: O-antigen ligase family protein [Oscillospiraceae bacterium]
MKTSCNDTVKAENVISSTDSNINPEKIKSFKWIKENGGKIPLNIWIIASVIFLIPLVPNLFAPFLLIVPFISTLILNKGSFKSMVGLIKNKSFLAIFALADVVVICIGIIPAQNKPYAALMSLLWVLCLLMFFSVLVTVVKKEYFLLCMGALVFACGLSAIISLLQCYNYYATNVFGIHFNNPFWVEFEKSILENLPILEFNFDGNLDPKRFCSTFMNSGVYAMYLILIIPIIIYFITVFSNKKMRFSILLITIFSASALGLAFSRTSYAVFIFIMVFLVVSFSILNFRNKRHLKQSPSIIPVLSLVVIIPLCLIILYISLPESIIRRFESSFIADNSKSIRFDLWEASIGLIGQKPIFGFGTGMENQWDLFRNLPAHGVNITNISGEVINTINEPHAHNMVLQILLEGGFLRLTTTLCLIGVYFKKVLTLVKVHNKSAKFLGICLFGALFGFIFNGMTDYIFVDPKLCGLYIIVIALGGCAYNIYKDSKNEYGKKVSLN